MTEVPAASLLQAVRALCGCDARLLETVDIQVVEDGVEIWRGPIGVFDLDGHLTANRAYGWSHQASGNLVRFAVHFHDDRRVNSPLAAAKAQIAEDRRPPGA